MKVKMSNIMSAPHEANSSETGETWVDLPSISKLFQNS
jgi:hypothetical protein